MVWRQRRLPDDRSRKVLDDDQPRSNAQHQVASESRRRPDYQRRFGCRVHRYDSRYRRLAAQTRRDLGRDGRRAGATDARRRKALDERNAVRRARVRPVRDRRSVDARRRHRIRDQRRARDGRQRTLRLRHPRLRRALDEDRQRLTCSTNGRAPSVPTFATAISSISVPKRESGSRSTAARTGNRSRTICRPSRSTTFGCSRNTTIS